MKIWILAGFVAITLISCSQPDPFDQVRAYRRQYAIEFDFNISNQSKEMVFEISIQNKSGGRNLQDLTLLVEAFDAEDSVIWQEQIEFDVSGVGNYATEEKQYKRKLENAEQVTALNVRIAPDTEGEAWQNYTEFMRIKRN